MSAAGAGVERFALNDDLDMGAHMSKEADGRYMLHADHARIVAALVAEREWRTIESAPKDETLFLAAREDGHVFVVRGDILARNMAGPTPARLKFNATHWQPLPSPPTTGDDHG